MTIIFLLCSLPSVKEKIITGIQEQAEVNLGMSMTFTLFEWLKEAKDELLEDQPAEATVMGVSEITSSIGNISVDDQGEVCYIYPYFCLSM